MVWLFNKRMKLHWTLFLRSLRLPYVLTIDFSLTIKFSRLSCVCPDRCARLKYFPGDHFLGRCGAVASKYTFCDHSVHSCATASQFKRSCAPHCVFHCASDCGTVRSLPAVSIYITFEPLSIIFLNREWVYVNLLVKRYKSIEIFKTLFMEFFWKYMADRILWTNVTQLRKKCVLRSFCAQLRLCVTVKCSCAPHCVRIATQLHHKVSAIDYMGGLTSSNLSSN